MLLILSWRTLSLYKFDVGNKRWYGTQFLPNENFIDLYNRFASVEIDVKPVDDKYSNSAISVYASQNVNHITKILIDSCLLVADVLPSIGKFVEFLISSVDDTPCPSVQSTAFDIMMASSKFRVLPEKCDPINKKVELKNNIIDWLSKNKVGWSAGCVETTGVYFLIVLQRFFGRLMAITSN